jgi:hypothetical protein
MARAEGVALVGPAEAVVVSTTPAANLYSPFNMCGILLTRRDAFMTGESLTLHAEPGFTPGNFSSGL